MTEEQINDLRKMGVTEEQMQIMFDLFMCCGWETSIYEIYLKMLNLEYYKTHGRFPE